MQYVRFGNSGMIVSRLCLGAMDFPDRLEEQEAIALVHHALDQGINFIDTADAYGRGTSEVLLGKALKGRRDNVVLATKLWVKMYDRPGGRGCSRIHMMHAVEDSLRRLQTDWIDLYQLHHPDKDTPVEETLSTLDTLVKQGKVRYVGVCNHYAWQMAHMLGVSALHNWEPLISIQCRYNILDRVAEFETVPFAEKFNIAMMTYGPLCGGLLSGVYKRGVEPPENSRVARSYLKTLLTDEVYDILEQLEQIAAKYEVGLNQLAILWVLAKPFITTPILGGSKPGHFEPMYNLTEMTLEEEDVKRIDELSKNFIYRPWENQGVREGTPLALNRW